jgi:hypothetical protein
VLFESSSEIGAEEEGIWATVCLLVLNMVLIDARPRLGLVAGVAAITSAGDILSIFFRLWGERNRKGGRVMLKAEENGREKEGVKKVFGEVLSGRKNKSR